MTFNEMSDAVRDANQTINTADRFVERMIGLCAGRLHKVQLNIWSRQSLEKLKKELRDYNMRTGTWKD